MTSPLQREQLSDLTQGQSVYALLDGQEWIVQSTDRNKFTRLAVLKKKDDPEWGTYTLNEASASKFSLIPPTLEEVVANQKAYEEKMNIKPGDRNYFACSCSPEGKNECTSLLKTVKELLGANDSDLLSKVVYSLQIDYQAEITSIGCDQWCGIWSKTHDIDGKTFEPIEPPIFTTEIQCDEVEAGIAATWYAYYKKFGQKRVSE